MNKFMNKLDVKLTIDTCHSRAWWIDITKFDKFISDFESKIWVDKLHCFHLNDAKVPLWSHLDRHASFWRGFIGVKWLRPLIERAFKNNRAMYLETPNNDLRPSEIEMIKKIVLWDTKRIDDFDKKHLQTDVLKKYENYSMIVQEKLL
jgi:deoxyribonuclease-4